MMSDIYELGDISDEETNNLIFSICRSLQESFLTRDTIESQLFPVNHYIHVACYILYDQSYQYNILKEITCKISPEEIAKRNKILGSPLTQLSICGLAMLYLHGRAQVIHDNLNKKLKGKENIVIEPEKKKNETKFILDFWRRLSSNYLNDGSLTIDNNRINFLSNDYINNLRDQMVPVNDKKEISKKLRTLIAQLTSFNFLSQFECRIGIYDHGPYYFEGNYEPLVFKEFQYLQPGRETFGVDISGYLPHKITNSSPVPNVIFGMSLKDTNKLKFTNWGTLFSDPSDFSSNITSIGVWTNKINHLKDLSYRENQGDLKPLSLNILDALIEFAKNGTKELYLNFSKLNFIEKLMRGVGLYTNSVLALLAGYAGLENDFNWAWALDHAKNKPLKVNLEKEKISWYIKKLEKTQAHPFIERIGRSWRKQKTDPYYYFLQD